jgi:hypothetical protein
MKLKICHLSISSFRGISPGAIHFYGSLWYGGERVELKKKMDAKQAAYLSTKDYKYHAGEITERFNSENEILDIAIKLWKKYYPEADVLLEGSSGVLDPQKCLDGPSILKKRINELWQQSREIGGWNGNLGKMKEIADEYLYDVLGWKKHNDLMNYPQH